MTISISTGIESLGAEKFLALETALQEDKSIHFIQVFQKTDLNEALARLEKAPITYSMMLKMFTITRK